jgi:hypothetical protein
MTEKQIVAKARAYAKAHVNKSRVEGGFQPIKSLSPNWWRWYGEEWINIVRKELKEQGK